MVVAPFALQEGYWESFEVRDDDIEFLYNFLLEKETPLTTRELAVALAEERIRHEKQVIEKQRSSGGAIYFPKDQYEEGQSIIFPAFNWQRGKVLAVRAGRNPDLENFNVIRVSLENGETKEFATGIAEHVLNKPPEMIEQDEGLDLAFVL